MAIFLERVTHSVDHMFSLYFDYLIFYLVSVFGFEGWIGF